MAKRYDAVVIGGGHNGLRHLHADARRLPVAHRRSVPDAARDRPPLPHQYTPRELAAGDWEASREALGELVVERLAEYAPGLAELVEAVQVLTPLDLR